MFGNHWTRSSSWVSNHLISTKWCDAVTSVLSEIWKKPNILFAECHKEPKKERKIERIQTITGKIYLIAELICVYFNVIASTPWHVNKGCSYFYSPCSIYQLFGLLLYANLFVFFFSTCNPVANKET